MLRSGLDKPAGFVLPLKAADAARGEPASAGKRARGRCVASACTRWPAIRRSAFGLPLASLPDVLPEDEEHEFAVDPFAPRDGAAASATSIGAGARAARAAASRAR